MADKPKQGKVTKAGLVELEELKLDQVAGGTRTKSTDKLQQAAVALVKG